VNLDQIKQEFLRVFASRKVNGKIWISELELCQIVNRVHEMSRESAQREQHERERRVAADVERRRRGLGGGWAK
jgi:hypothetical protein